MALTHIDFMAYPLQIAGIDDSQIVTVNDEETTVYLYDEKIGQIEDFVVEDLAYGGEASDVSDILPYFVFWYFCQDCQTTVFAETGENSQVKEFSTPETFKQIQVWNMGVRRLRDVFGITDEKLNELCGMTNAEKVHSLVLSSGKTINENYLSMRSLL